jgi:hypothetical protein
MSGEGKGDEGGCWGPEAIKAVGDADFQWRTTLVAPRRAQAAAAPSGMPRGTIARISR